jgi:hypothetical protein
MRTEHDRLPWPPPRRGGRPPRREPGIAPTQVIDQEEEPSEGRPADIGHRMGPDLLEMFVAGHPAVAVDATLQRLKPEFIALHDLGCRSSEPTVAAIAAAAARPVQRLALRREGPGVRLAVLHFVELPLGDGRSIRLYSTAVEAAEPLRHELALVLLGRSRLGAVMVGALQPPALVTALESLQRALQRPQWCCHELLFVPLGSPGALGSPIRRLSRPSSVTVRVTPQAARASEAWAYVSGAWNRMHGPQQPAAEAAAPVLPGASWGDDAERCTRVKGAVAACVVDGSHQRVLAFAGSAPTAQSLAAEAAALCESAAASARRLGLGPGLRELVLTLEGHHLLLHPVAGHPGVMLHLVVDASATSAMLARLQVERVEP